jgi:DNA-binding transcriptional regulator YiaG
MTAREIVALRVQLGLTQEQFAACIQSRQNTVALWETGRHKPSRVYQRLLEQLKAKVGPVITNTTGKP